MKYEFGTSHYNLKEIQSLDTGDLFVEEGDKIVYMATDEQNETRRCVNLENGLIVYFEVDQKVRPVTLVEPPIFDYT